MKKSERNDGTSHRSNERGERRLVATVTKPLKDESLANVGFYVEGLSFMGPAVVDESQSSRGLHPLIPSINICVNSLCLCFYRVSNSSGSLLIYQVCKVFIFYASFDATEA
jgi:hypothetical protein